MPHKAMIVPFSVKTLSESGQFSGEASPYGVRDLGNDIVDDGAFAKTIAERGHKVRLLDGHAVRIGVAVVTEGKSALEMAGTINLDKQAGRDAYSDLKFYHEQGLPMGLSIGYDPVKTIPSSKSDDGARHLTEIRLWEISITEFPMNESAQVTNVKHNREESMEREIIDFTEALNNALEQKAGRRLSTVTRSKLEEIIKHVQALLEEEAADAEDTPKDAVVPETKALPIPEAAKQDSIEPEAIHSGLEQYKSQFIGAAKWN